MNGRLRRLMVTMFLSAVLLLPGCAEVLGDPQPVTQPETIGVDPTGNTIDTRREPPEGTDTSLVMPQR